MSEISTALLLGLYVFLAGLYGLAFTVGRLVRSRSVRNAAAIFCVMHLLVLIAIVGWTPLGIAWKAMLLGSSVALLFIPPLVWRLLEETHRETPSHG